jgi:hypothetical protein
MIPNPHHLDARFPEGAYRFAFESSGGPTVLRLAVEGGFDGDGHEFDGQAPGEKPNGVDTLTAIGHAVAVRLAAGNRKHADVRLVEVGQGPPYKVLWRAEDS